MSRRSWLDEEYTVLVGIFSCSEFIMGDDNQPLCHAISKQFNRTPGSIDRQWRNIKDILNEKNTRKVAGRLKYWTNLMILNPRKIRSLAIVLCEQRNWDLREYLGDNYGN